MKQHEIFSKWMTDNYMSLGRTAKKLSEINGTIISPQNVHCWRRGDCNPSLHLRPKIEIMTQGKVKAKGWGKKA